MPEAQPTPTTFTKIFNPKLIPQTYKFIHRDMGFQFNVITDDMSKWMNEWLSYRQINNEDRDGFYSELIKK